MPACVRDSSLPSQRNQGVARARTHARTHAQPRKPRNHTPSTPEPESAFRCSVGRVERDVVAVGRGGFSFKLCEGYDSRAMGRQGSQTGRR
jgi:hypothetical protein